MNENASPVCDFWQAAASVALFAALEGEARDALAAGARRQSYRAGELVAGAGTPIDSVFVVESGRLRVTVPDARGSAVDVARPGPGEYCGDLPLIRHEGAGARIEALEDAVVWAVPHALLDALGARWSQAARSLAAEVACHAFETDRRLGRTRARGRMVGAVSFGDAGWAAALLARTALSASRMLQRPVLLVDLTDATAVPTYARELPDLSDLLSQPGQFAVHDAFAAGTAPRVGVVRLGEGRELGGAVVVELLADLAGRYPLVIAHVPMTSTARPALVGAADTAVAIGFGGELEVVRRTRLPAEHDVVVLTEGATPDTEGERRRLGEICRARVLRVVPGGPVPLVRNGNAEGEPWQSVDWLARHFLRRKVGLALGAGGVRGYAHLGVLAALEEAEIPIDYFAGTSIGAPLAAGAAIGVPPAELRRHLDDAFGRPAGAHAPWRGTRRALALRAGLGRLCGGRTFESLRTPLTVAATDLDRRSEYLFRAGPLAAAVAAACATPVLGPPVVHDGRRLVDGAVLSPVPTRVVAAAGADLVLGVLLAPPAAPPQRRRRWRAPFSSVPDETALQAFELMQWELTAASAAAADLAITPAIEGPAGPRDWRRADAFIEAGRAAVEQALPRLRARFAPQDAGPRDSLAA